MIDDGSLREKARVAIQAGSLPNRLPDRVWGGPATAGRCAICGEPMRAHEGVEFEIVFSGDRPGVDKSCCVHPQCLTVFEREVQNLPKATVPIDGQAAGTVADSAGREDGT
jgi:hypothetical protein